MTDFSEWSPYSEILVGSPVHKLTINPTILEIKNLTELKGFDLEWEYPSKELYRVKDIELEYAKEMYSPYTTVATGDKLGILGDVSIISIKKAMKTGYYRLRLKGYHKEYTLSMPKKIIVPNTIPPEAPVGLNAKKKQTDEYTVVRLKWKPNKEWDLLGYRIYRSTEKDGDYKLVDNNRFFEEAKYTDYVSKASGVEAYYYSIRAVDQNYNHSKLSESVKVSIFEETKEYPIKMLKKEVSQDAIEITFRIPEGKQTKKFSLYRKTSRSDFSQFVQDFEIEKGEREFSFVDTYIQDDTYYSYFGISFYESGKISKKQYFPLIYVPKKIEEEKMPFSVNVDTDKKGIYRIEFSSFTIKGVKIYVYKKRGEDQSMVLFFQQEEDQKVFEDEDYRTGDSYSLYVVSPGKQFPLFEL
ncbi:MAG: hypothetical protein OIF50_07230 [Flavobacteriaceae bacterium]|nr:hypothetical protein [Flavobacteriaceae bacterium]